ncbi:hypothetical protein [Mycolicibacterium moriokaense]|uniref:Uncharacterized protein n=1 Tax=Mycolicibacterium moriokaense TaxID=39691 RepID=A0AAD1M4X7_9MYCO|nr:hypothetical protein [Mycolicibacterium moriokaense]MCV7039539.1 hypothetical protein [Mycolicibacterium moriokaense]BBW99729.1 hypothetical protein MMOR_06660 [Mycolicibacterium moriokaense]
MQGLPQSWGRRRRLALTGRRVLLMRRVPRATALEAGPGVSANLEPVPTARVVARLALGRQQQEPMLRAFG